MDSNSALSKRSALFGPQSPLRGVQTERGTDSSFRNFYISAASGDFRERLFDGYREFQGINGLNRTYVDQIVGQLITPFIAGSYVLAMEKLDKPSIKFDLEVAKAIIRELLKKLFITNNISVAIDNGDYVNEHSPNSSGLHFAFDYLRASNESDLLDPLAFEWLNGTVTFAGKSEIGVSLFIPINYIKAVVRESFTAASQEARVNMAELPVNLAYNKARETISNDIMISVIQNIYVDRAREYNVAQLRCMFDVTEIYLGKLTAMPTDMDNAILWKSYYEGVRAAAKPFLQQKFGKTDYKPHPSIGDFVSKTFDYTSFSGVNIHPVELYKYIFSINDVEANAMIKRFSNVGGLGRVDQYSKNNLCTRDYLNHVFKDDVADVLATGLDLLHMMPIVLFSIFFYGGGTKIGYFQRFAVVVKEVAHSIDSMANTGMNTRLFFGVARAIEDYLTIADTTLSNSRLDEILPTLIGDIKSFAENGFYDNSTTIISA